MEDAPKNHDENHQRSGLADGRYDVVVVDIAVGSDKNNDDVSIAIEVVVADGPHKGDVVTVEFSGAVSEEDALEALGVPGVLTVVDGQPQLQLDESG